MAFSYATVFLLVAIAAPTVHGGSTAATTMLVRERAVGGTQTAALTAKAQTLPNPFDQTLCDPIQSVLDFSGVTSVHSNLDGQGPDTGTKNIRYAGIATVDGKSVDLVVHTLSSYVPFEPRLNGVWPTGGGPLGIIDLRAGDNVSSNEVDLKFSFQDSASNPVTMPEFDFSILDFDTGIQDNEFEPTVVEKVKVSGYDRYYVAEQTTVDVGTDGVGRTVFTATVEGNHNDNPKNPASLSQLEASKTIDVVFKDKSEFVITLIATPSIFKDYGRHFLFAGRTTSNPCSNPAPAPPPAPAPAPPPSEICNVLDAPTFSLDFYNAQVTHSNLGGAGPDTGAETLVLASVAEVHSRKVDLVVETLSAYTPHKPALNGKWGHFGLINLETGDSLQENTVDLLFRFVDFQTGEAVTMPEFDWSILDMDMGYTGGKEEISATGFEYYLLTDHSEVEVEVSGANTIFRATKTGGRPDNPADPLHMTYGQVSKSVLLRYKDVSEMRFTLTVGRSNWVYGRDFMFSGHSAVAECAATTTTTTSTTAEPVCEGQAPEFNLDFFSSTVRESNLGGRGPDTHVGHDDLVFIGIGTASGREVDLVVNALTPYEPGKPELNGVYGAFGLINMNTGGSSDSNTADFKFKLVDSLTGAAVTVPRFDFSILDLDMGLTGGAEKVKVAGFEHYYMTKDSLVEVSHDPGGRTVFTATQSGGRDDNPTDPLALSDQMANKAVDLIFHNVSEWTMTLEVGSSPWLYSRDFMFAGYSGIVDCGVTKTTTTTTTPAPPTCHDTSTAPTLEFAGATVSLNNLGGKGPSSGGVEAIKYDKVFTTASGTSVSLVVEALGGYTPHAPTTNGLYNDSFGLISMASGTASDTNSVDLKFEFQDTAGNPVTMDSFDFSFLDIDAGLVGAVEEVRIKGFDAYYLSDDTDVHVEVNELGEYVFSATESGFKKDTPMDPKHLSAVQAARGVDLQFTAVSEFHATLVVGKNAWGGGRDFLFAGRSAVVDCGSRAETTTTTTTPAPPACSASAGSNADMTELNLAQATVVHSNLRGHGPDNTHLSSYPEYTSGFETINSIVYSGIAEANFKTVDLVVTDYDGYYTPFHNMMPPQNGKNGTFGLIQMATGESDPSEAVLKFQFVDTTTGHSVPIPAFDFSIFDLDSGLNGGTKEVTVGGFSHYYTTSSSEITVSTGPGGTTTFTGSQTPGTRSDHPTNPLALSQIQADRTVTLHFDHVSEFTLTLKVGTSDWSYGRDFLFAGRSAVAECGSKHDNDAKITTTTEPPTVPDPVPPVCLANRGAVSFVDADVVANNLAGAGPVSGAFEGIRYAGVTSYQGNTLDLMITATSSYKPHIVDLNGKWGSFGLINLQTGGADYSNGVDLVFTIVDSASNPMTVPSFDLSILDLDMGRTSGVEKIMVSGMSSYFLSSNTEVAVTQDGNLMTFSATQPGDRDDNPSDPLSMTAEQVDKTVQLRFTDVSEMKLRLEVGPSSWIYGRDFMFAANSAVESCGDEQQPTTTTTTTTTNLNTCFAKGDADLSLVGSTIAYSNLGGAGPDSGLPGMRFKNIGTSGGKTLDLVVTTLGTYTAFNSSMNGKYGQFGLINLGDSSEARLRFRIVDAVTNTAVKVPSFELSFLDVDSGITGGREEITTTGIANYFLTDDTQIDVDVTGSDITFSAKSVGLFQDEPAEALAMTDAQADKTVTVEYVDVSEALVTLAVTGSPWVVGRDFLFAGRAAVVGCGTMNTGTSTTVTTTTTDMTVCETTTSDAGAASFRGAKLIHNNLGNQGPDSGAEGLHFGNVTTHNGRPVDVMINAMSSYTARTIAMNGMFGEFGLVNMQTGDARHINSVDIKISLVDAGTLLPVTLPTFDLSVLDMDMGYTGGKESVKASGFESYYVTSTTLITTAEDAQDHSKTVFTATETGGRHDNPVSASSMTKKQADKSVNLRYADVSEIFLTLEIGQSAWVYGRDFMFAGRTALVDCGVQMGATTAPTITTADPATCNCANDAINEGILAELVSTATAAPPCLIKVLGKQVTHNNLGGQGPDAGEEGMVFADVATFNGRAIDLKVNALTPYVPHSAQLNGKWGAFGLINMEPGDETYSTHVDVKFSVVDSQTGKPVTIPSLDIAFFDLDTGFTGGNESVKAYGFEKYFTTSDSALQVTEDIHGRTVFTGTQVGDKQDNPSNQCHMTEAQARNTVDFNFKDFSSAVFTLEVGPSPWAFGRSFLFSGKAAVADCGNPHKTSSTAADRAKDWAKSSTTTTTTTQPPLDGSETPTELLTGTPV